jgi:hypothetical protein
MFSMSTEPPATPAEPAPPLSDAAPLTPVGDGVIEIHPIFFDDE